MGTHFSITIENLPFLNGYVADFFFFFFVVDDVYTVQSSIVLTIPKFKNKIK